MERTPDLAEEIVGYRAWFLEAGTPLRPWPILLSLYEEKPWATDDWTYAECSRCQEVPGEHCRCGIYAARDRRALFEMSYGQGSNQVIGEVGLAGRVVVAERGYRAQKGRPRRLYVPYTAWQLVHPLRESFGIPVELSNVLRRP